MQQTGIVKWFSRPKGFGFVVSEAGEDVFVPHDALRAAGITELKVGERLCFVVSFLMTAIYNLAKNSECTLRFHLATEAGWDAGCGGGCLLAAALIAVGVPLGGAVMISLGGSLAALLMLRRYYAD